MSFLMLSDNLFNLRTYPKHTLAGEAGEVTVGNEIEYIQSGRRQKSLNHWTPVNENSIRFFTLTMDRVRCFDTLVIDRGHNLDLKTIRLRVSSNGFADYTEKVYTLPDTVRAFSELDSVDGTKTPEGAWLVDMGFLAGKEIRIVFDAMGAGLKPQIVGIYAGLKFKPQEALDKPFTFGMIELDYAVTKSPFAWTGAGHISQRRIARFNMVLISRGEYAQARYHVESQFLGAKPTWIIMDDQECEKAFLVRAEPGTQGFEIRGSNWSEFQGSFEAPEHEPKPS